MSAWQSPTGRSRILLVGEVIVGIIIVGLVACRHFGGLSHAPFEPHTTPTIMAWGSVPDLNTWVPPWLHAVVHGIPAVCRSQRCYVAGIGWIVGCHAGIAVAEHWASRDEGTLGQGPIISAVRLVVADAPALPRFGRNPLWLVTLHGLANTQSQNPWSPFATALLIINARTGTWLQGTWVLPGHASQATGFVGP